MAGSLRHITNNRTGKFQMDLIENLGDAHEALDECFKLIHKLTGGDLEKLRRACDKCDINAPSVPMRLGGDHAL